MKINSSNSWETLLARGALLAVVLTLASQTSCTTMQSDEPAQASDEPSGRVSARQSEAFAFFGYRNGRGRPTKVTFTAVDPDTGSPKKGGLKSFVLGGIAVPGILEIKGFDLSNHRMEGGALVMDAKVNSTYINVPPKCGKSTLTVRVVDGRLSVKFKPVYCNWVAIGNVISYVNLKNLELKSGTISGKYTIGVNGTANGQGSGSFVMRSR